MAQADDPIDSLDFTDYFSPARSVPEPLLSAADLRHIDDLGLIGSGELRSKGFYTPLVDAATRRTIPHGAGAQILVVEDDEGTAAVISKVLQSAGYQPRLARDLGEIVKELARTPFPDLVLLDVMLPSVNGFDVLNRLRQHPALKLIPVVMLTSRGEQADLARGLALGADGYLTKPAMPSTLLDAVRSLVED